MSLTLQAAGTDRAVYFQPSILAGDTVSASTSEQAFASACVLPAGSLKLGTRLLLRARCSFTTPLAAAPGSQFLIRLGGTAILTSSILSMPLVATGPPYGLSIEAEGIVRAVGVTGSLEFGGSVRVQATLFESREAEVVSAPFTVNTTAVNTLAASVIAVSGGNVFVLRQTTVFITGGMSP